jgi:hypothetical protein
MNIVFGRALAASVIGSLPHVHGIPSIPALLQRAPPESRTKTTFWWCLDTKNKLSLAGIKDGAATPGISSTLQFLCKLNAHSKFLSQYSI